MLHYLDDLDSKMEAMRAHFAREDLLFTVYAAFGACILAASGTFYMEDVRAATREMATLLEACSPSTGLSERYNNIYGAFRQACTRRGYI